jgi:photosystem II stability/assembly factor-like uncharacterized protein
MSHRVYVGAIGQGVFRSVDGGQTFRRAADGMFVECDVRALVVHPIHPRVLYLGSEHGVYRSTDGADSWSRLSDLDGAAVWALWLQPGRPEVILAGTCPAGVWRSEDGGEHWTPASTRMERHCPRIRYSRVTGFAADPQQPEHVWVGVEIDGLHESQDGGRSWQQIGTGLTSQDLHGLLVTRDEGKNPSISLLLATTNRGLNLSRDGGWSWGEVALPDSAPWNYTRGLIRTCASPEVVLLGLGDGPPGSEGAIGRSLDGGQTWSLATLPGRSNSTIWNFAVHPADANLIYASSVSGEVYRSHDGGASWEKLHREFGEIRALAWAP